MVWIGDNPFYETLLDPVRIAAKNGYIECLELLKTWGKDEIDFNEMIRCAALGGHVECMKFAQRWGETDFHLALEAAAEKGNIKCMKLAKEWGAVNFTGTLKHIQSIYGDGLTHAKKIKITKLLKQWKTDIGENTETETKYLIGLTNLINQNNNIVIENDDPLWEELGLD